MPAVVVALVKLLKVLKVLDRDPELLGEVRAA